MQKSINSILKQFLLYNNVKHNLLYYRNCEVQKFTSIFLCVWMCEATKEKKRCYTTTERAHATASERASGRGNERESKRVQEAFRASTIGTISNWNPLPIIKFPRLTSCTALAPPPPPAPTFAPCSICGEGLLRICIWGPASAGGLGQSGARWSGFPHLKQSSFSLSVFSCDLVHATFLSWDIVAYKRSSSVPSSSISSGWGDTPARCSLLCSYIHMHLWHTCKVSLAVFLQIYMRIHVYVHIFMDIWICI